MTPLVKLPQGYGDEQIAELAEFLGNYPEIPFFVRPGYEFELQYAGANISAQAYAGAFQRIVDGLRDPSILTLENPRVIEGVGDNTAFVFSSASVNTPFDLWLEYYPGNDYVDWLGLLPLLCRVSSCECRRVSICRPYGSPNYGGRSRVRAHGSRESEPSSIE